MDFPGRILSAALVAPCPPYGFGGTRDVYGRPCYRDFAGSGAGMIFPHFAQLIAQGDRSTRYAYSPRLLMRKLWRRPIPLAREEELLSAALMTHVGRYDYPGDARISIHWPNLSPGRWGINNAMSPAYMDNPRDLWGIQPKPPLLWLRGDDDRVVADRSMADVGAMGEAGLVPGWPGEKLYPPQPMIGQTRYVLEQYGLAGGYWEEVVFPGVGHVPQLEVAADFGAALHDFWAGWE
jgi:pimeloyl-ACP methyl ester carboxylesterase